MVSALISMLPLQWVLIHIVAVLALVKPIDFSVADVVIGISERRLSSPSLPPPAAVSLALLTIQAQCCSERHLHGVSFGDLVNFAVDIEGESEVAILAADARYAIVLLLGVLGDLEGAIEED